MERIEFAAECLKALYDGLTHPLNDDEAWLRIELGMLIHDLKIIQERDNG